MKKGTAIFPGWLFPFVYCVAGVDAYVRFVADYPYPKVYSDFCYQKSIRAILSGFLLETDDWVA